MTRKKYKDKMKPQEVYMFLDEVIYTQPCVSPISLGCCTTAPTPWVPAIPKIGKAYCGPQQEQGNNPMNYDYNSKTAYASAAITQADPDQPKRDYLVGRLQTTYYTKESDLRSQFGLEDDAAPKTPKEMADRIAAGKFVIRGTEYEDAYEDGERYFYPSEALSWRDPTVKEDHDGYITAIGAMNKFRIGLLDIVKVKDLDAAFDTIKALEDWQPTGKAN